MKLLIPILDRSLGRFVRMTQGFLMRNQKVSLVDAVHNLFVQSSAEYVAKNVQTAMILKDRFSLYDFCIQRLSFNGDSSERIYAYSFDTIYEFGVYKGGSINYFAKKLPNFKLVGFDSFVGLEEDWTGTSLGEASLSVNNNLPQVCPNVILRPGFFVDSLPKYVAEKGSNGDLVRLINIDCDTYIPTKFILSTLRYLIKPGLIIIFDEYLNYINWPNHEFRAWREFTKENNIRYRYIAFTDTTAVAIEII